MKWQQRLIMRIYFVLGLLSFSIISCTQKIKDETDSSIPVQNDLHGVTKVSLIDTSKIAIIEFDKTANWPIDSSHIPTQLTIEELITIDSLLNICIRDYNENLSEDKKSDYSIDFKKYNYKLQYVAIVNNNDEKEVWVNCFCDLIDRNDEWRKGIIRVMDGGNCYFNLKINLSTKSCSKISVNGYA